MKTRTVGQWTGVVLFFFTTCAVNAQWFDQGAVLSSTEENDTVGGSDRHYTQGLKFSYLGSDNSAPGWLMKFADAIPSWGFTPHAIKIGTEIGQSIYTPDDLDATQVVTNDRPYAGWLYTGIILQRRGLTGGNRPVLESFQLDVGVVGPDSLAEDAQEWAHTSTPEGWDNQIRNEFGFALKYMRAWLLSARKDGPRTFDFIPYGGFSAGNIDTSFRIGGTVRVGINLPDDFGLQTINSLATTEGGYSPSRKAGRWGVYIYGAVEGSAVAYNEFLDGNAFRDDVHHVTHEPLLGELRCGLVMISPRLDIGASFVWHTDEFTRQTDSDLFGSLFVKLKL